MLNISAISKFGDKAQLSMTNPKAGGRPDGKRFEAVSSYQPGILGRRDAKIEQRRVGQFADVVENLILVKVGSAAAFGDVDRPMEDKFGNGQDEGTGDHPDGTSVHQAVGTHAP